jgi:hypothetical protein
LKHGLLKIVNINKMIKLSCIDYILLKSNSKILLTPTKNNMQLGAIKIHSVCLAMELTYISKKIIRVIRATQIGVEHTIFQKTINKYLKIKMHF